MDSSPKSPVRSREAKWSLTDPLYDSSIIIAHRSAHLDIQKSTFSDDGHRIVAKKNGAISSDCSILCDEEQLREFHADLTQYIADLDRRKVEAESITALLERDPDAEGVMVLSHAD